MPRKTSGLGDHRRGPLGFNEAAARCRGKPTEAPPPTPEEARLQ